MSVRVPLPVRLVHLGLRAARRAGRRTGATAAGIALGLLDRDQLHRLDRVHYDRLELYRSEAHNVSGLFDWEREAVDGWFGGCRSLLVVGAGGGREVLALTRIGFTVDAYECNARLVRTAAEVLPAHGCNARVLPIAPDSAPPPGRSYDGLIVGWSAYMLMPGRETRVRFLCDVARLLVTGAPILLSFFTRTGAEPRLHRIAAVAGRLRRLRGAAPIDTGDDLAPNYVHRFTDDEVRSELRDAGFDLIRFSPEGPGPRDSGWAVGRLA